MAAQVQAFVIDCPRPRELADFYAALLGSEVTREDDDGWVVIGDEAHPPVLAFQPAPDHVPPQWPDPAHPQQMHLDLLVDDMAAEEERALALGARRVGGHDPYFRVYVDLAGHPFCLVRE